MENLPHDLIFRTHNCLQEPPSCRWLLVRSPQEPVCWYHSVKISLAFLFELSNTLFFVYKVEITHSDSSYSQDLFFSLDVSLTCGKEIQKLSYYTHFIIHGTSKRTFISYCTNIVIIHSRRRGEILTAIHF